MTPEKVREIIDIYWDDVWGGHYKSDWEIATVDGTSESEYCDTHYYKLWVYYDEKWCQTLVAFVPQFIDGFPSSKWLQVQLVIITIDFTGNTEDEVYEIFAEHYKELHAICAWEEFKEEYPDGDWEEE